MSRTKRNRRSGGRTTPKGTRPPGTHSKHESESAESSDHPRAERSSIGGPRDRVAPPRVYRGGDRRGG